MRRRESGGVSLSRTSCTSGPTPHRDHHNGEADATHPDFEVVRLAALAITSVLETLLFGVEALDAPTFTAMSAVMLAVTLLASYIPARRASSVDPMQALRAE